MITAKTLLILIFIGLLLSPFCLIASSIKLQNKSAKQAHFDRTAIKMLKQFYHEYANADSRMAKADDVASQIEELRAVKEKYCSAKLINWLDKEEIDVDPFLKSQDFNIEWLKTLKVEKEANYRNQFIVTYSFFDHFRKQTVQRKISLVVVRLNGEYKIDDVR